MGTSRPFHVHEMASMAPLFLFGRNIIFALSPILFPIPARQFLAGFLPSIAAIRLSRTGGRLGVFIPVNNFDLGCSFIWSEFDQSSGEGRLQGGPPPGA